LGCSPVVTAYHPWTGASGPWFRFQTYYHHPSYYCNSYCQANPGSDAAYSQNCVSFHDLATGNQVNWCPQAWDSRGAPTSQQIFAGGSAAVDVNVPMSTSSAYSYGVLGCTSQDSQHDRTSSGDWYMEYLPWSSTDSGGHGAGMLYIINYVNAHLSTYGLSHAMSTNPSDWVLTGVGAGSEVAFTEADQYLGSSVSDVMAMDDNAPCVSTPY
jgi:hypothetical protein